MHPPRTSSLDLLSYVDAAAVDAAPNSVDAVPAVRVRGIAWVLKWAAALAVLVYSTTVLTEFAYCVAAEQMLSRAARAGVLEATLARATRHSVEQSVWRRLDRHVASQCDVKLALLQNGNWVGKKFQPRGGDQLTIMLEMPAQAAMPNWLRKLTSWRAIANVTARAERIMPGRQLITK